MKSTLHYFSVLPAFIILFASCASTTMIESYPSGADVYINNQKKGITPYRYRDTKIVGSQTDITLTKAGYQDMNFVLTRDEQADVGAIIGGVFFLVPFLWTMKYDPVHNYELIPGPYNASQTNPGNNATNELIKLQDLLLKSAITEDEFTTLKVKVLNDEYDYKNNIADQISKLKGLLDANLLTREEYNMQKKKIINGL